MFDDKDKEILQILGNLTLNNLPMNNKNARMHLPPTTFLVLLLILLGIALKFLNVPSP